MRGYIKLIVTALFWGGAFFAAKESLKTTPPIVVACVRFLIAGCILLAAAVYLKALPGFGNRALWKNLFILAFSGIFLYNICFFSGLKLTDSVNGSLIVAGNPGITALLNRIFNRERLGFRRWIGIIVSFCGVLLVVTKASVQNLIQLSFNTGDLLIIGATFCWAVYTIRGKRVMLEVSALAAAAIACSLGAVMLLPLAVYQAHSGGWVWIYAPRAWIAILYMSVFASALGYIWWYQGVQEIGSSRSAIFINLVPVSVLLMSMISGDLPSIPQISGAAFVLTGVYLTTGGGGMQKETPGV